MPQGTLWLKSDNDFLFFFKLGIVNTGTQRSDGCPMPGIIQGQLEGLSAIWSSGRCLCSWQDIGLDDL